MITALRVGFDSSVWVVKKVMKAVPRCWLCFPGQMPEAWPWSQCGSRSSMLDGTNEPGLVRSGQKEAVSILDSIVVAASIFRLRRTYVLKTNIYAIVWVLPLFFHITEAESSSNITINDLNIEIYVNQAPS